MIGHLFYNSLLPKVFLNNTMQAKATFAAGVMGLYASKLWSGESGFGHGCPITWLYSPEPNTGKTEAMLAVNSMLGFHTRSPCSGDSTKAALFERTSQQADLSVTVDDVVVPQGESRTFAQIIRALYDCSTRTVTGKVRRPKSTAMFTVRFLVWLFFRLSSSFGFGYCSSLDFCYDTRVLLSTHITRHVHFIC